MMRLTQTDFSKGLWIVAGKETTVKGFLRRAKGMNALRTPSLRSRWGGAEFYTLANVVDLFVYAPTANMLHLTSGGTVYNNTTSVKTGYGGTYFICVIMPPQPGIDAQIFVLDWSGSGAPFKMTIGGTVTNWGIVAPTGNPLPADNGAGAMGAGTYRYLITFLNHNTGSRSNPNPTANSVTIGASRQVQLTNIPVSSDSQVTRREIYRTSANGARFFRIGTINDNTTTTFNDNIVDTSSSISSFEIQFDNIPPPSDATDAWAHGQQMWWCADGTGRAYYSPPGRPESLRGFIEVGIGGSLEDCRKGISWGGANWVFTTTRLFRIEGDAEPYVAVPVTGVPGTQHDKSVAATPYGIVYLANDGLRLFDGSRSRLIGLDSIGLIFRGEGAEGLNPIDESVHPRGMYIRDEYWLLTDEQTLAIDLRDYSWRQIDKVFDGIGYEPEFGKVFASFGGKTYSFEDGGTYTDGVSGAIDIEWEFGAALTDIAHNGVVQRIFLDINTLSSNLTVTVITDNTTTSLGTITTTPGNTRTLIELPVGLPARLFGVRLSGSVNSRIELYGIAIDVKLEGSQDEVGIG